VTAALNPYFDAASVPWEELGGGIRRKIVGHTPELMSVLVQFDQGAVGTPHAHDAHDQIAYVPGRGLRGRGGGRQAGAARGRRLCGARG
jgi:quercetin dioxygenase-like cupin family protein